MKIKIASIIFCITTLGFSNLIIINAQSNMVPNPYFTSPANDEFMSTIDYDVVKVYENEVNLQVVDLSGENDITNAVFDFSYDGIDWLPIGEDYYNGFEGIQFNGDYGRGSTNGLGTTGWNIVWFTDYLNEGYYFLRVTLFDEIFQEGSKELMVHFDPTPPFIDVNQQPTFNDGILGPLVDTFYANALTNDEDPALLNLDYIDASRPVINQEGLGDANQENVGTPNTNGTPQTDDDQNNFCAPTSAANALWRLAQNDPALLGNNQGGQYQNATQMAEQLGNDTNTDPINGTASGDLTKGLRKYLKDRNLEGNYTVKPHIPKTGERGPWWSDVGTALRQGEAVILLKVQPGSDGIVGTSDDIGHYETGKDAQPYPGGGGEVSVRDPKGPTDKSGQVKVVPKNNGFEGIWFDDDNDGEEDDGEVWYLLAFWEISPNNNYTWGLQNVEYTNLGEDANPSDGFSIPVETNLIPDGFYLLRYRLFDLTNNVGMNRTTIYVNNNSPTQVFLEISSEDVTSNSVTLHWTENMDEDFHDYQIYVSETPEVIGDVVETISDWTTTSYKVEDLNSETTYYFAIKVTDYSGLETYSDQIQAPMTAIPEFSTITIGIILILAAIMLICFRKILPKR